MRKIRHIFIVNPTAGKLNRSNFINEQVNKSFNNNFYNNEEFEVYVTKGKCDATNFVNRICNEYKEEVRFYACGGDGTLCEVVNGVIGHKNASISVIPYGTGNDFVRNFTENDNFYDLDKHINAPTEKVDLLNVDGRYSINICSIGFDAKIGSKMNRFKILPFINGSLAYTLSVFYCLLSKMTNNYIIKIDDNKELKGEFLLCAIGNGSCYGGGYKATPLAQINDGVIDVCIIKKIARHKLVKLINLYKKGEHLNNEELQEYVIYEKCKKITLECDEPFEISLDGEIYLNRKVTVEIEEGAVMFSVPSKVGKSSSKVIDLEEQRVTTLIR